MSFLAGIYNRIPGVPIPDSVVAQLTASISRRPEHERTVFRDARVCLVKVDIGAFGAPGYRIDPGGSVSMLAGEPLLAGLGAKRTRAQDLEVLHRELEGHDRTALSGARGAFCAVHYRPDNGALTLATDKLGLRSFYCFESDAHLVFATSLRVLEGLPLVAKEMDVRAVTEITVFGYPLGRRTPYTRIAYLAPAEVVEVAGNAISRSRYWRWDTIRPSREPEAELVRHVYDRFLEATVRRVGDDTATFAFLSGGLDSRCVTGALRGHDVRVYTVNMAPEGTQDHAFSSLFATAAGAIHENFVSRGTDPMGGFQETVQEWVTSPAWAERARSVERQRLAWSGNGGSFCVGHVGMSPLSLALLRSGQIDAAVSEVVRENQAHVARRVLTSRVADILADVPRQGVFEEIRQLECEDPARSLYLFWVLNEQRRHVANHLEHVDLKGVDYQLPFFDTAFLEAMLMVPMDACLGHKFYSKWLAHFPAAVTAVPWQTYPGSVPCPLPVPAGPTAQWSKGYMAGVAETRKRRLLGQAWELLRAESFPSPILSRGALRFATWMHRYGVRDYSYLINTARTYHRYWQMSDGRLSLPDRSAGYNG